MTLAFFKNSNRKAEEPTLDGVSFTVYKFNNRPKPQKISRIKIIGCFSEFGCEVLGCQYCIPRLMRRYPGQYIIAMGWHGREYLYRHLVDEFWEIKEEYMWLREYTRAFHNISSNLQKIEKEATAFGEVIPTAAMGKYAVANLCRTCGKFWQEWMNRTDLCPACKSTVIVKSIFTDIATWKPTARQIPGPSAAMLDWADGLVKPRTVGIFARNRKAYGRNLPPEFYVKLIELLESLGYGVIWLGEKQSTLACPLERIIDFSRMEESRDLEKTLAIISKLEFTVQFWTASTRLSGLLGKPFLLFESPEQIYASASGIMSAQEGKRLELTCFGPKKIVIAHYRSVREDMEKGLSLVERAIGEMNEGNWQDILGMVEDVDFSTIMQKEHYEMLK